VVMLRLKLVWSTLRSPDVTTLPILVASGVNSVSARPEAKLRR
jgi:hypothetical protein